MDLPVIERRETVGGRGVVQGAEEKSEPQFWMLSHKCLLYLYTELVILIGSRTQKSKVLGNGSRMPKDVINQDIINRISIYKNAQTEFWYLNDYIIIHWAWDLYVIYHIKFCTTETKRKQSLGNYILNMHSLWL